MSDARVVQTLLLDEPVTTLARVDARRAEMLGRLGIRTRRDLIEHFPRRYVDMSQVTSVEEAEIGQSVTVVGTVDEVVVKRPRPRLTIVEVSLLDDTGVLFGTWFRQPWIARQLHVGDRVAFSGKVEFNYGFKRMNAPIFEVIIASGEQTVAGRVIAVHPLTEGISSAWMRRFVATALADADVVCDPLPVSLRLRHDLLPRAAAWRQIHLPASLEEAGEARRRIVYEELLCLQVYLMSRRLSASAGRTSVSHVTDGPVHERLLSELPFELTGEQREACRQIDVDMGSSRPMNRMLLGDVGTGKTVVALLALANAVDSRTQGCIMAPTSVLAEQYVGKLGPLLDQAGVPWALLTGSTPPEERERILESLATGALSVVFGTHALLEDDVFFSALSLVVIDEEHRFGVAQRERLRAKGPGSDLLVMTATPIPRTLALSLYGDLDCSYLHTRPRATAPTTTTVLDKHDVDRAYAAIRDACSAGRQAYIVCPLVGVSSKKADDEARAATDAQLADGEDVSDPKAAEREAAFLATKVFPELEVGLMTGRMSSEEKSQVMQRFREGKTDVLVSTTVVEVGVDVPNATVMLVHDAERFGLAQLHQLRGRIGRGAVPGQMFLLASARTKTARERLQALSETTDGFELAERDLRLRHEGDVLGCRQHGLPSVRLLDVTRDGAILQAAHDDARELLSHDPLLQDARNVPLAAEVHSRYRELDEEGESR
ncbi:MAG: ATP-dependent DNA helicase RecG [Coriobacteriales bacterium]